MSDTSELRRLAQSATPGGWYVEHGNYVYGCKDVTDGEEEWHPVIACTDDSEPVNFEGNAAFIAAANPTAISELLDRLEAAEKERDAAELMSLALLVKIEQMEQQEPVAWLHETRRDSDVVTDAVKHVWGKSAVGSMAAYSIPLFTLPGTKGEEK